MRSIFKFLLLIISCALYGTGTQFLSIPSNGLELAIGANAIQKTVLIQLDILNMEPTQQWVFHMVHG